MKKKHKEYYPESGWEDTQHKEKLVKRAWESIRRSPEFKNDCKEWSQLEGEAKEIRSEQLKEKWGVAVFASDYSYDEVKNVSTSMKEAHGSLAAREEDKDSIPEIPMHLSGLYNRLSGDINRSVHCEEWLEVISSIRDIMKETGQVLSPSVDQWPNILKARWNPERSRYAHLTIDIDAPIEDILKEVEGTIESLFALRLGMGFTSPRSEKERYHFDDDEENFKVYDLFFEQGKIADEIIKVMWLEEYKRYGGRDTETAEKGRLIQRAYDKRDRIIEWIKEYSSLIKHSSQI